MKQVYRVTVAGIPLNIVTDEEENYLLSLVDKLSRTVSEIVIKNRNASKTDAAILCALDGLDAKEKLQEKLDEIEGENERLRAENERLKGKLYGQRR